MLGLPLLIGRRPAGGVLLGVGGLKLAMGLNRGHSIAFLAALLVLTVFTHLLPAEWHQGEEGASCSAGGFFFFGGGGCGSSCGGACGSSCGGACGGGCGGCG